jgi:predicted site-specific integrase-resolvase
MKEKEEIMVLQCKHVFHRDCLDKWFSFKYNNTTCPLCRISVTPIKDDKIDDQELVDDHCQITMLR